jgi:hypothetical protein
LSAAPGAGAVFKEWRGACAGSGASCSLTPTTAVNTTAVFSQVFTDDPIVARTTRMTAAHITELRNAINMLRSHVGLAAAPWTDPVLVAHQTIIKAQHVLEMRSALSAAYVAAGRGAPAFAETITPGQTSIKASHISELRAAIRALE